jgi:hypothetical protein
MDTFKQYFPMGAGIIALIGLSMESVITSKKDEFGNTISIGSIGSMPLNREPAESGLPLFLNFYPQNLGQDFELSDYIQRLKYEEGGNTTIPRGVFNKTGYGQFNRTLFETKKLPPVILIPGLGATQLFARWNKDSTEMVKTVDQAGVFEKSDSWACKQVQDQWSKIWYPNTDGLANYCWSDNTRVLPTEDGSIANVEGVSTITQEFGSLDFANPAYMSTLIETLEAMGYVQGENLFGAGYDFRKIGDQKEFDAWCLSLTSLIERSSKLQEHPCVLIGHDLGSVVTNAFLVNGVPQWKKNHIKSFVSVSGTFGGCPKALRVMLSGSDGHFSGKQEDNNFGNTVRNFSGLSLMLPRKEVYGDNPLVHFNEISYNSYDIPKLLNNVSPEAEKVNKINEKLGEKSMMAPGVPVYIMGGDDINTESSYKYRGSLINNPVKNYPFYQLDLPSSQKFSYPDYYSGDGTMPRFALEYPLFWAKSQKEPVFFQFFTGAEHTKILSMNGPMRHIVGIIRS